MKITAEQLILIWVTFIGESVCSNDYLTFLPVTLNASSFFFQPKNEKFEFPDIFPEAKEKETEKQKEQIKSLEKEWKRNARYHSNRPGVPSWFGV